jgi:hypothetical protein
MANAEGTAETDLILALRSNDEERILAALDMVDHRPASPAELDLIRELAGKTGSRVVRNAAAIALTSLNAPGADELLIDLIKRKDTRGANGTLLYGLREMNAYVPLPLLIDILVEDRTYEALEGALDLIAINAECYDAQEKTKAVSRLKALMTLTDAHASHSAKLATRYLTRRPTLRRR